MTKGTGQGRLSNTSVRPRRARCAYQVLLCLVLMVSCLPEEQKNMTVADADLALHELAMVTAAQEELLNVSMLLTGEFNATQGVQAAHNSLMAILQNRIYCTTTDWNEEEITLDFGDLEDECLFEEVTYGGAISFSVISSSEEMVELEHRWENFTNGGPEVSGKVNVRWVPSFNTNDDHERDVSFDLQIALEEGGGEIEVVGNRVQTFRKVKEGYEGGLNVDGMRFWTSDTGSWSAKSDGIELDWDLPLPCKGTYEVVNPQGKEISLDFKALEESRVEIIANSGDVHYTIVIGPLWGVPFVPDAEEDDDDD